MACPYLAWTWCWLQCNLIRGNNSLSPVLHSSLSNRTPQICTSVIVKANLRGPGRPTRSRMEVWIQPELPMGAGLLLPPPHAGPPMGSHSLLSLGPDLPSFCPPLILPHPVHGLPRPALSFPVQVQESMWGGQHTSLSFLTLE